MRFIFLFFYFIFFFENDNKQNETDKVLDPRFWWNATSLSEFVSKNLQKYMLPVIQGFVSIEVLKPHAPLKDQITGHFFCLDLRDGKRKV